MGCEPHEWQRMASRSTGNRMDRGRRDRLMEPTEFNEPQQFREQFNDVRLLKPPKAVAVQENVWPMHWAGRLLGRRAPADTAPFGKRALPNVYRFVRL